MSKHHNPMAVPHSLDSQAQKFIAKTLNRFGKSQAVSPLQSPAWPADFFGLDKSDLFKHLPEDKQTAILEQLSLSLLLDSFGIEKIGIAYCGRMSSTAPTMEERQLFAMMGADEAIHYQWLCPYIPHELRCSYQSPILEMMSQMLELDAPNVLYYLSQIILEGWSIRHYKALSAKCQDETLTHIIKQMLKDESSHHYTGKVLFNPKALSPIQKATIVDYLKWYTEIIRMAPSHIVQTVDKVAGLSKQQHQQMLESLEHQKSTQYKLSVFKQLMSQPGMESVVDEIDQAGYFEVRAAQPSSLVL